MYATTAIGIVYSFYILLVLTLMAGFAYGLASQRKISLKFRISITIWIIFLVVSVAIFHTLVHIKFPWTRWQVLKKQIIPEKEITVNISDYKFQLPENPIELKVNVPVKFKVYSQDVTYGFGVFREDGTLLYKVNGVFRSPKLEDGFKRCHCCSRIGERV